MQNRKNLLEKLERLPDRPGVYLMKNKDGKVIYVGKALSLRKRVRSYFQPAETLAPRPGRLASRIADLEYIVTDSEMEALLLECNLIKEYHPCYNVRLKDDKKYPFVKLTAEDYPRLFVTRNLKANGSKYYGPYTNVKMLRRTLKFMRELFPLRSCRRTILSQGRRPEPRPCLNYHLKQCAAPCAGRVGREEYLNLVKGACLFLEGKIEKLIIQLTGRMKEEAAELRFEEAGRLRDKIEAVKKVTERQKITVPGGGDEDYIAFAREEDEAAVNVFLVREGKAIGQEHFFLKIVEDSPPREILTGFLKQYYSRVSSFPRGIVLPDEIDEPELIGRWLKEKSERKIKLLFPQRGRKRELLRMVERDARLKLQESIRQSKRKKDQGNQTLLELERFLHLSSLPSRIEAFDVSHTGGKEAVGSMIVYEDGHPERRDYRHFKIKLTSGADDYAMIKEVVARRYRRILEERGGLPDLILIDGGKGHLHSALGALENLGLEDISVVAIAKQFEHIFIKGESEPVILPREARGLRLIQEIRDEAHRFAVEFHRGRRRKKISASILDTIPGVGEKRKRLLLTNFGSLEGIRKVSVEEIAGVTGIGRKLASRIQKYLVLQCSSLKNRDVNRSTGTLVNLSVTYDP